MIGVNNEEAPSHYELIMKSDADELVCEVREHGHQKDDRDGIDAHYELKGEVPIKFTCRVLRERCIHVAKV